MNTLNHSSELTAGYDAETVSKLLGLRITNHPHQSHSPIPNDGEIIIYYGGWSLKQLFSCTAGQRLRLPAEFEEKNWDVEPGYYRLLLPVPGSDGKTLSRQLAELRTLDRRWRATPVALLVTALLVHLAVTRSSRIQMYRCAEPHPEEKHVVLVASGPFVYLLTTWDGAESNCLWLAAAQKL